jgi:hypothetical protein
MYVDLFCKKYGGNYHAITHLSATYTDNGNVRMSYVISDKKYHLTIEANNPYAEEIKKRTNDMSLTTGSQIVALLGTLYPTISPKAWEDDWVNTFEFEASGCILHIRVDELPSLDETIAALKSCGINPSSVGIENRYGHLTLTITNFNIKTKEDITFINN